MRIICGLRKGKKIIAPDNLPARPTTDMAKESLFNILNNFFYFNSIEVLDLFAGTGNISYEFAAREAIKVTSIDNEQKCIDFISKTSTELQFENIKAIRTDAIQYIKNNKQQYNIVFADPPYNFQNIIEIPNIIFQNKLIKEDGWFVLEHSDKYNFENHKNFYQNRRYGRVNFSFFINV